jgi:hypothetical protein
MSGLYKDRWMKNQHLALWRSPSNTQRQARDLISGPDLAMGARLLSFNRTQTRAVIGLLIGHNTLRKHLHVMGLSDNPHIGSVALRRKPRRTFCVNVRLWPHSGTYIWVPSFGAQKILGYWEWGPSGTLSNGQGSYNRVRNRGYRGPVIKS